MRRVHHRKDAAPEQPVMRVTLEYAKTTDQVRLHKLCNLLYELIHIHCQ